jgi:hypothetical protein
MDSLGAFVQYASKLKGDERSESQNFLEHLFQAFGHKSLIESGIILEDRVKKPKGKGKKFADLVWPGHLLIEMKSRGEHLDRHYRQAFDYWCHLVPHRPHWVILCNFDEFWIYDFDVQVDEPLDKVALAEIEKRSSSLSFLRPTREEPVFGLNRVQVTKQAADLVARTFNSMILRGINRDQAQRFVLQCVVCMFSEDLLLLPKDFFSRLLSECLSAKNPETESFEKFGGLFRQMNEKKPATGGRYKGVRYFNGGLFSVVDPIELNKEELNDLFTAAEQDWSKVNPAIFGTLFQHSMGKEARHAFGAHYTSEADIMKVVSPTIIRPWRARLEAAKTLTELVALWDALTKFRVLDPACGSGNFLYVAFRELKRIETDLIIEMRAKFPSARQFTQGFLSIKQFYGFDILPFAVELTKVTLLLAKELGIVESNAAIDAQGETHWLDLDPALPLDNLDENIKKEDALFVDWSKVDAIIGNPPYQAKNKMPKTFGTQYVKTLRKAFPSVPGRADYCVYFFRKAHDELGTNCRAGLVGTNTIRQNFSRIGGLDYIVANGGTITEAVSSQVWSGEAKVHVSIVNWVKGTDKEPKNLSWQDGDRKSSPWKTARLEEINSSLSPKTNVGAAQKLVTNAKSNACYQGQTHGHEALLLPRAEAEKLIVKHPEYREVLQPYLIGDDLLGDKESQPSRYAIDLNHCEDLVSVSKYTIIFEHIKEKVMPDILAKAEEERIELEGTKEPTPRQNHARKWWRFWRSRNELMEHIKNIRRYATCVCATKRPIFEFISPIIHPNAALQVFPLEDDYSFGILQSDSHWQWFTERCSTLKRDFRYTSDTVFDSFAWPQEPGVLVIKKVAEAGKQLREIRRKALRENNISLRELYRTLETPGDSPVKNAQKELNGAVREAYGMTENEDVLAFLLKLNLECAEKEAKGQEIVGPGLPKWVENREDFVSEDCIRMV